MRMHRRVERKRRPAAMRSSGKGGLGRKELKGCRRMWRPGKGMWRLFLSGVERQE
jgi:hypothetical protein